VANAPPTMHALRQCPLDELESKLTALTTQGFVIVALLPARWRTCFSFSRLTEVLIVAELPGVHQEGNDGR